MPSTLFQFIWLIDIMFSSFLTYFDSVWNAVCYWEVILNLWKTVIIWDFINIFRNACFSLSKRKENWSVLKVISFKEGRSWERLWRSMNVVSVNTLFLLICIQIEWLIYTLRHSVFILSYSVLTLVFHSHSFIKFRNFKRRVTINQKLPSFLQK